MGSLLTSAEKEPPLPVLTPCIPVHEITGSENDFSLRKGETYGKNDQVGEGF